MAATDIKTVVETVQSAVTTVAVVVGAVWTYFKFIRGRTFRPHVQTQIDASWLPETADVGLIHVRIQVTNIGQAKVELDPDATGLYVSRMADKQTSPPSETRWDDYDVAYDLFSSHQWIEPGELVTDDLLIRLPAREDVIEIKTEVVLRWKPRNISVKTRRVFTTSRRRDGAESEGDTT